MSEDLAELKEVFKVFDKDGGGSISLEELGEVLSALGGEATDGELLKALQKYDTNGDGEIQFDEFEAMMKSKANSSKKEEVDELKEAFKVFDKDGSGTITANELCEVLQALGEPKMNMAMAQLMIESVDVDKDGFIDFNEFKSMMMDAPPVTSE